MNRIWINVFVAFVVSVLIFSFGWLFFPHFYQKNMELMLANLIGCIALQTLTFICIEFGKSKGE